MSAALRVVALALCVCSATAGAAVSCKKNSFTGTNNASYDDSQTVIVDQTGARVIGPDGAEVDIPPGALTEATEITIGKLHGSFPPYPPTWAPTGSVYSFEPHGQTFKKPVEIRVPYKDPGKPFRLAVSAPNVAWDAVAGADFGSGFAHTTSTHFSFYAIVTGAPLETDAGPDAPSPDAEPDAEPDAPFEAGPPPGPTLFASVPTRDAIVRFALSPTVVLDAGADAAFDAGMNLDGGVWTAPGSTSIAMNAGPAYSLFTSTHAWLRDGGTLVLDGGAPIAIDAGAAALADPFGTPMLGGAFAVDTPGVMMFVNGELWMSVGAPPDIETFVGATRTWSGASAGMTTGAGGFGGIAYDPATRTVFLSVRGPDAVQRWSVAGTGAAKNAVKVLSDLTVNLTAPTGLAFTPWNELLVVTADAIARFDANGAPKGKYSLGITPEKSVAVVRWPGGADEMFVVDAATHAVVRFVFTDAAHASPVQVGTISAGAPVAALVVAP